MKIVTCLLLILFFPVSADALELEAPQAPETAHLWMPAETSSLWDGCMELLKKAVLSLRPDLREAERVCLGIIGTVLLASLLQSFAGMTKKLTELCGTVAISSILLFNTNSMIHLGMDTVQEIADYGKLLLPVMTTALATQGGITSSSILYTGTALFSAVLQSVMDSLLIPGIYLYLALSIGNYATGENMLKKFAEMLRGMTGWILRILLIVFTTYLSLTRVISGTTDAAALKATRIGISTFIPVIGGILSDASEAVLVSAGLMKNTAGIYGILVVLSLFVQPFLRIGSHYFLLRVTGGLASVFGTSRITGIIEAFAVAMGLLLAITGAQCIMVLISTVCFMKGVG